MNDLRLGDVLLILDDNTDRYFRPFSARQLWPRCPKAAVTVQKEGGDVVITFDGGKTFHPWQPKPSDFNCCWTEVTGEFRPFNEDIAQKSEEEMVLLEAFTHSRDFEIQVPRNLADSIIEDYATNQVQDAYKFATDDGVVCIQGSLLSAAYVLSWKRDS